MLQAMINKFRFDYPEAYATLRVEGALEAVASDDGPAYHYGIDATYENGHRRRSGSYYTDPDLARRVCAEGLVDFCRIRFPELGDRLHRLIVGGEVDRPCLERIQPLLASLDVLDLAVGSGVFPVALIEVLLRTGITVDHMRFTLIDLQADALQAARFHLYRFAREHGIAITIDGHRGDALLTRMPGSSYDLVIGNPPYIGEKNNKAYFRSLRNHPEWSRRYEAKMDLFYFFVYRGLSLLSDRGVLSFVTTSYFLTATGARAFRTFLREEARLTYLQSFGQEQLFSSASLHSAIFGVSPHRTLTTRQVTAEGQEELSPEMLFSPQGYVVLEDPAIKRILHTIWGKRGFGLGDVYEVNQGIVSGFDRLRGSDLDDYPGVRKGQGVFVHAVDAPELEDLPEAAPYLVPFYKNSDLGAFRIARAPAYRLLYLVDEEIPPSLIAYLAPFKERLSNRREVKKGLRRWYQLTWSRKRCLFESPAILCPQRAKDNCFAYSEGGHFGSADLYYITGTAVSPYSLRFLLGYLNSSLVGFWLTYRGKRKGELLELYGKPLSEIPLPEALTIDGNLVEAVENVVDSLIDQPDDNPARERLDHLVYRIFDLNEPSVAIIEAQKRSLRDQN